jgi:hypothetical protein
MSNDSNFRVIIGGEKPSSENQIDPDVVLSLELIKGFRLLSHDSKLEVIRLVKELASSSPSDAQ